MRLPCLGLALLSLSLAGCGGDSRGGGLNFMSPEEENKMGQQAYTDAKAKEKVCQDAATVAYVNRVAHRLEEIANPMVHGPAFTWEVTVFESSTVNAWCLPGGKIGVYTAILPYCENEAALAAVLGHEIGHAVMRHGGQRMTSSELEGLAGQTLGGFLQAKGVSPTTGNMALTAFGAGSTLLVSLPFSRHQETQADEFGLEVMAKAGYDPQEAVRFWSRFAQLGGAGPAFFSDHPASADREAHLQKLLPGAEQWYQAAPQHYGAGEPVPAAYRRVAPAAPAAK
jgi:predicted Zn-dependent protease